MLTFLLVIQAIVAVMLVTVILMQQSEGGALGMGGSPTGLMSARGAADFLTRSTAVLATVFVALSILHAVLAAGTAKGGGDIDTSLARPIAPTEAPAVPAPGSQAPAPTVPLASQPPVVPIATAQPKVEQRPTQQQQQRQAAPRSTTPENRTAAPPPVTSTVTPSIPRATPEAAPAAQVQGPPANSN